MSRVKDEILTGDHPAFIFAFFFLIMRCGGTEKYEQ